ncbi:transposase [Bradyrhizobium sp. GM24.11]
MPLLKSAPVANTDETGANARVAVTVHNAVAASAPNRNSDAPRLILLITSRRYALAVAKALPQATQVADRWHLMENASHAFLDAVRKSMRQVRVAVGSATINPALLTAAERIQYEGYLRREDTNAAILRQAETGVSIKEIVRLTGHSRGLVRKVLRGQRTDVFRVRESSLEHHLSWLDAQWTRSAFPWFESYQAASASL